VLKVASCDRQGAVYLDSDTAFRIVDRSHRDEVEAVLHSTADLIPDYIVETRIETNPVLVKKLSCNPGDLLLGHRRVEYISYPHEWCAEMLKDAALFHLDLSLALLKKGLYLKDAHPWNILFDGSNSVFIDFTSIVNEETLFNEEYLQANTQYHKADKDIRLVRTIKEIFERMFLPYFLVPLAGYFVYQPAMVKKRIEETTLNTTLDYFKWRELFFNLAISRHTLKNLPKILLLMIRMQHNAYSLIKHRDIAAYLNSMRTLVAEMIVARGASGYSGYYSQKGEDQSPEYSEGWNDKQKGVYEAISKEGIKSVLDAACNTGWYARMAAKCGKNVVAFDIDEASIEILYSKVKRTGENILPLVLNIMDPTTERLSIVDNNRVLIEAVDRLKADSVLALGIIHHLVLGVGASIDAVVDRLTVMSKKQLVVEFVSMEDEKIQAEPEFFHVYYQNPNVAQGYSLDALLRSLGRFYSKIECKPSHPDTRTLVICEK